MHIHGVVTLHTNKVNYPSGVLQNKGKSSLLLNVTPKGFVTVNYELYFPKKII